MKFSTILSITAIFGAALSEFVLPDLEDGTYLISIGDDGKQVATPINNTDVAPTKRDAAPFNSRISKRYTWPSGTYPWCPGGDWFLQNDFYAHAYNAFYDSCYANGNHKFPQNTVFADYQGTAVAYMCAYTTNPCNVNEWADAVNWAAGNCIGRSNGWMEPGYLHVPAWNKRYGYAKGGSSIC